MPEIKVLNVALDRGVAIVMKPPRRIATNNGLGAPVQGIVRPIDEPAPGNESLEQRMRPSRNRRLSEFTGAKKHICNAAVGPAGSRCRPVAPPFPDCQIG
jgi:hypothetical protein